MRLIIIYTRALNPLYFKCYLDYKLNQTITQKKSTAIKNILKRFFKNYIDQIEIILCYNIDQR